MDVPTLIDGQPNLALLKYMAKVCQRKGRRAGPDEPAELLQDAVVLLLRKAHLYDPARGSPTAFAHYVCNSTQSKRATSYRRRSARVRVGHVADRPDPRTPDPADAAERAEVLAMVAELRPDQRELLTRRFGLDGERPETCREIATDRHPSSVASRIRTALKRLRRRMCPADTHA